MRQLSPLFQCTIEREVLSGAFLRRLPPKRLEISVGRDLIEPRLKGRFVPERVHTSIDPKKSLLGEVVTLHGGKPSLLEEAVDGPVVALEEPPEILLASGASLPLIQQAGDKFGCLRQGRHKLTSASNGY